LENGWRGGDKTSSLRFEEATQHEGGAARCGSARRGGGADANREAPTGEPTGETPSCESIVRTT